MIDPNALVSLLTDLQSQILALRERAGALEDENVALRQALADFGGTVIHRDPEGDQVVVGDPALRERQ